MSVRFYDEAFLNKLKAWCEDTPVTIYGPNDTSRIFESIADMTDDSPIKLPIICLSRSGGYTILNTHKQPLSFDGATLEANDKHSVQLNAIPININYQIDVYTRYLSEADEYIRNLVFNIINYPKLQVTIPYLDVNYVHTSNIRMTQEVEDNSNIPERLSVGQFTRFTLSVNIDDAYLWDIKVKTVKSIIVDQPTIEG